MCKVNAAKHLLREKMKNVIEQLSSEEKQRQSKEVFEKLCALTKFQNSKRISLYLSREDEIDTIPILKHAIETKKEVFVPRYKGQKMEMVKLHSMKDYEKLPLTKWNIKQPNFNERRENALETGKRLGHGMGYYDKFLELCLKKQQNKPHIIAVAFNEQVQEDIPSSEYDIFVDLVLTAK
ncbi:methenyltetrahydrofolate synthetase isoform X2 [Ptiloglossa arizonensis]|uniref:methenyltetrahydrofolate synthetase isoform X2 n=1 Tax=Ptiloglossa arizonensis TaxID=3350558 RepID=UPI003F9FE33E